MFPFILSAVSKNRVFLVICDKQQGTKLKYTNILPFLRTFPSAIVPSSVWLYLQILVVNNFKNYFAANNVRHHFYSLLCVLVVIVFFLLLYN